MMSTMNAPVRFSSLTIEPGKPLSYVTVDGKPRRQKQLRREMDAVTQIFQNWATERKAEIDKITAGRDIRMEVMTSETYDAHWSHITKEERKRNREVLPGFSNAFAARIGAKLYDVDSTGKKTRLQVRWPGNNPEGPFYPGNFQDWAEQYILKPRNLFNALSKALKMGVQNIGVENKYTFEDHS